MGSPAEAARDGSRILNRRARAANPRVRFFLPVLREHQPLQFRRERALSIGFGVAPAFRGNSASPAGRLDRRRASFETAARGLLRI